MPAMTEEVHSDEQDADEYPEPVCRELFHDIAPFCALHALAFQYFTGDSGDECHCNEFSSPPSA